LELVDDLDEPLVHVLRPVHERLEGGRDEVRELLDGRLAKTGAVSRMKSFQN